MSKRLGVFPEKRRPIPGRIHDVFTSHGRIVLAETEGAGPPLLLMHGNSFCKESFGPQFEFLEGRRRLIAIDLPGHGQSQDAIDPRRTYSLPGYADCAFEVLDRIGVERAAVLGWSLGGHIALEMTARPSALCGVMTIGSPPFVSGPDGLQGFLPNPKLALAGASAMTEAEIDEYIALVSGFEAPPDPFWRAAVVRADGRARAYLFESLSKQDARRQRDLAERCPVPLAMVNGGADPFVDVAYVATVNYRNLWSGRTYVLTGVGHAPHIHAPERFNRLLERFLETVCRT